jgi:DNA repair exonuclease SbcCD ATPase subunit
VSEAWPAIKIREFEHVVTGATSLLRVSGEGPRRREPGHRPALMIDDGIKEHRFSALPAPPDEGRTLRAAYAVPSGLVRNARSYWLQHENGKRTNLSVPETGVARMGADQPVAESDSDLPDAYEETRRLEQRILELEEVHARELRDAGRKASDAEQRVLQADEQVAAAQRHERALADQLARATADAEAQRARVTEAEQTTQTLQAQLSAAERELSHLAATREPLERELGELRAGRKSLEREVDHARDQLRVMTNEREEFSRQAAAFDGIAVKARERAAHAENEHQKSSAALQELEIWRAELERRLAATTTELGAAKAAHEADQRELERLRESMVGAHVPPAGPAQFGRGLDSSETSETLAAQAAEIERLAAEVAALRARAGRAD